MLIMNFGLPAAATAAARMSSLCGLMCPDSLVLGVRGFCALTAFGGSGV